MLSYDTSSTGQVGTGTHPLPGFRCDPDLEHVVGAGSHLNHSRWTLCSRSGSEPLRTAHVFCEQVDYSVFFVPGGAELPVNTMKPCDLHRYGAGAGPAASGEDLRVSQ